MWSDNNKSCKTVYTLYSKKFHHTLDPICTCCMFDTNEMTGTNWLIMNFSTISKQWNLIWNVIFYIYLHYHWQVKCTLSWYNSKMYPIRTCTITIKIIFVFANVTLNVNDIKWDSWLQIPHLVCTGFQLKLSGGSNKWGTCTDMTHFCISRYIFNDFHNFTPLLVAVNRLSF